MDVCSKLSSTRCSDDVSDLRGSLKGSAVATWTGVGGPAEDGAVGKYSEPEHEEGVRQIEGRSGEAGGSSGLGSDIRQ